MISSENTVMILGVCAIVLVILVAKKWMIWGMQVLLRALSGAAGIYFMNLLLPLGGITIKVGINLFNMLVVGVLGFPGFGLLYAISALDFLY